MLKRFLWASLVGLVAVFTVAGVSTAQSDKSKARAQVLRVAIGAEPPSLDPGLATDTTSAQLIYQMMEPLIKLGPGPTLRALPGAARSWRVRGATVTLNLRRDVRWTTGQRVVAADYVWAWLRTISPELGSDYAYQFYGIKGAEAYNGCKSNCGALRSRVGVKAIGRFTLRVQLTSSQPWFIQQLAHHSFLAVHRETVERFGNRWTEAGNIVSNGPFRLAQWEHDSRIDLAKWNEWRDAANVSLQRVNGRMISDGTTAVQAFEAGEIDVTATIPPEELPRLKETPEYNQYPGLGTYYYGINLTNVPDVNQRRAMALAVDRRQ